MQQSEQVAWCALRGFDCTSFTCYNEQQGPKDGDPAETPTLRAVKRTPALLLFMVLIASCSEEGKAPGAGASSSPAPAQTDSATIAARLSAPPAATEQISQYIRRIFQDRDGNIWFGTTSDGVVQYDGRSLTYFKPEDGFGGNWVSSITQDAHGDLWFGTGGGVSRYDGIKFTNYTTKDGLTSDQVWCMLEDKSGGFWIGTEEGVSRYDGRTFTAFPIPAADLNKFPYYKYPKQINAIIQDKAGNIWFASNGGGVYKYDPSTALRTGGSTLTNLSEKDGLCNNFVQAIMEDRAGNLWFGTRYGGLCKYDGTTFTTYTAKDLKGDHVWALYQDSAGLMWIAVATSGLCSFDGTTFTCYGEKDGAGIRVVQSLMEDASGQLWIGTSNGVYRFNGGRFTNWTKQDAVGD